MATEYAGECGPQLGDKMTKSPHSPHTLLQKPPQTIQSPKSPLSSTITEVQYVESDPKSNLLIKEIQIQIAKEQRANLQVWGGVRQVFRSGRQAEFLGWQAVGRSTWRQVTDKQTK